MGGRAGGVEARAGSPGILKVAGGLTIGIVVSLLVGASAFPCCYCCLRVNVVDKYFIFIQWLW